MFGIPSPRDSPTGLLANSLCQARHRVGRGLSTVLVESRGRALPTAGADRHAGGRGLGLGGRGISQARAFADMWQCSSMPVTALASYWLAVPERPVLRTKPRLQNQRAPDRLYSGKRQISDKFLNN